MKKVLVLFFVTLFAVSALASDWGLYGSVRLQTFYENQSKDLSGIGKSDTDLNFGLQGNSRVGANVKVSDKFSANVELGIAGASNANAVKTRLIYGTYDFGNFKFRVGQDYTPTDFEPFNQVYFGDNALDGFGGVSIGRSEQIKLMAGGFEVALVRNSTTGDPDNYDTLFPKLELGYGFSVAGLDARVFGGLETKKVEATDNTATNYIVGFGGTYAIKPATVNFVLWYGQNTGDYGLTSNGTYDIAADENSKDFGGAIELGFEANDMLSFNVGYGYQQTDRDDYNKKDAQQSYYANAMITVGKGYYIVPEVGVLDYMKDSNDNKEGKLTYFGAKWQMNF
ncbi:hypothetical protein DSN97_01685 [Deferribacteraceae bacterium V6Fe1]|nr:hypothetical protein DSN97_01685 [Deferribacteraceae bacterium V6Fe1]